MENYITLSHLNDFIFCPRSIYFHQLYSKYNEQHYKQKPQIEGTAAHTTVDTKKYSTRKTVLQALEVYTEQYNIVGKIDVFDTVTGRLTERKNHIVQIYDGYIFQVFAQYFGLVEMGYEVKEIIIHDLSANKNYPIQLPLVSNPMLYKFTTLVNAISSYDLEDKSFVPNIEKCKKCIYSPLCDKSLC